MTIIYTLSDPWTKEVRYVGKTTSKYASQRLSGHLSDIQNERTHKANWIRSVLQRGGRPIIEEIERVPNHEWIEAESFWITYFRFLWAKLTNGTRGGDGAPGRVVSVESRRRMSESHTGFTQTPEARRKIAEAGTGRIKSEATRRKLSVAMSGRTIPDSVREKIAAKLRGSTQSVEVKAKKSATLRAIGHKPSGLCQEKAMEKARGRVLTPAEIARRQATRLARYLATPPELRKHGRGHYAPPATS